MNSFELNKIIAAVVITVLIVIGIGKISDVIYHMDSDVVAYKVEAPEGSTVQASAESSIDISAFLAMGDVATGENIVPFSDFTKLSCDVSGSFFTQWLNTFEPNRVYKIMLKLKTTDGNEQIFDEDFEFKVKR